MKKPKMKVFFVMLITAVFFSACISMRGGDISIDGQRSQTDTKLAKAEEAIVPLEAVGGIEARKRQEEITSARQIITSLEKEASADADYNGKLLAWSGRLAILEGKYTDAQRLHRQSNAVSQGNVPAAILGIRLEGDPSKRLEMIERELSIAGQRAVGVGELNIERGRALTELNRFSEAAGAFDTAFSSRLSSVYSKSYTPDRNRAWELRNTTGVAAGTLDTLGRDTITWNDCITITKNETQLLRFLTAGRSISDTDMFNRLVERGFIPYAQDVSVLDWPSAKPKADENVTRAGAAWFIWHLYAEARADRNLLTRYSARYATGSNPRSPITDIPPLSPFFDSILGCVETEQMSLIDGRNFRPAQSMRGAELLSVLKKIDN